MQTTQKLQKFYANKKVLVTGGAGFIGSHLVEKLVELGAKVTVLDNFSSGVMQNLQAVLPKIKLIIGDIAKEAVCASAVQNQTVIFHTAAMSAVGLCQTNPAACQAVNVQATENLLKNCAANTKFLFSSSAAVYGNHEGRCTEEQSANPTSIYGQSKLAGEELCGIYAEKNGLQCFVLRYFNVFGPRQENNQLANSVVVEFKKKLSNFEPLTIFGDGHQTRDFVSVFKVVDANLWLAAMCPESFAVFNVASGKSMSMLELVAQLEKQLKVTHQGISFKPARVGDILKSEASCEKYQTFYSSHVAQEN